MYAASKAFLHSSVIGSSLPSTTMVEHLSTILSGAPFITSRYLLSFLSSVSWMDTWNLLVELKGISQTFAFLFLYSITFPLDSSVHLRMAASEASPLTFLTQVSETDLTLSYLSLRPATSASASACVVIFWAAALAESRTFRKLTQFFSKVLTFSSRALTWSRSDGLARPSAADFSAPSNQGLNSLIPVLYSAQYLTSLEYLSHSIFVSAWSFST